MKLEMIGPGECGGGECPTLYKSEDGRFFVQGYKVDQNLVQENKIPQNETIIEINSKLLEFIKNS